MLEFAGIQKTTLIDYPGEVACTFFLSGCNFRCGYCYNPELALGRDTGVKIPEDEALEFLKERRGFLDAVCITGGEPLIHFPGILHFCRQAKALGYKIKIDTNGSFPERLQQMISENAVDYIAMDVKAPLEKYCELAGAPVNLGEIRQSIRLIKDSGIDYEFRTTVPPSLEPDDFEKIGGLIAGGRRYYLQRMKANVSLLDGSCMDKSLLPSVHALQQMADRVGRQVAEVGIRG